jgi:hypothetical protein
MAKIKFKPTPAMQDNFKNRALISVIHGKWFYVSIALLTYIVIREIWLWMN